MPTLEEFFNHPIDTLERALHIRKQIDQLNEVLKELFGPTPVSLGGVQTEAPKKRGRPPKLKASAEPAAGGLETGNSLVAEGRKKRRKMSTAARAKIAAAQKARWAAVKAKKPTPASAKSARKKKR